MKVKSIEHAGKADVFNMEVDDTHDFAVANGVIAHNCYDEWRYVCMENPITIKYEEKKHKPDYDPLDLWEG